MPEYYWNSPPSPKWNPQTHRWEYEGKKVNEQSGEDGSRTKWIADLAKEIKKKGNDQERAFIKRLMKRR